MIWQKELSKKLKRINLNPMRLGYAQIAARKLKDNLPSVGIVAQK
jgi:hypothetical protein